MGNPCFQDKTTMLLRRYRDLRQLDDGRTARIRRENERLGSYGLDAVQNRLIEFRCMMAGTIRDNFPSTKTPTQPDHRRAASSYEEFVEYLHQSDAWARKAVEATAHAYSFPALEADAFQLPDRRTLTEQGVNCVIPSELFAEYVDYAFLRLKRYKSHLDAHKPAPPRPHTVKGNANYCHPDA